MVAALRAQGPRGHPKLDDRICTWKQAKPIEVETPGAPQCGWTACGGIRLRKPLDERQVVRMMYQEGTADDELTVM